MEQDALFRSIALRDRCHMFLLGAGASVTSGIPTAADCIWDWKRRLFLTQNPHLDPRVLGPVSLPHVHQRIQRWLDDQRKHPPLGADTEYSHYVELCFPLADDRRDFFKQLVRKAQPHLGYRLLGILLEAGKIQWIWTTNFDDLVDRGRPSHRSRPLLQIGMDSGQRFDGVRREDDDAVLGFLHGDYRYDPLKNTESELRSLDEQCRKKLIGLSHHLPLVVLGYSGRDKSVMEALTASYSVKGTGGIYWGYMAGSQPSQGVQNLLEAAHRAGNVAESFTFNGFDDFFSRLARLWLADTPHRTTVEAVLSAAPAQGRFSVDHLTPDFDWVLGNAYEVELPTEVYSFAAKCLPDTGVWRWLRSITANQPIVAGIVKSRILAFGRLAEIEKVFSPHLDSKIAQVPLAEFDLGVRQGVIREMMLRAMTLALGARGLEVVGRFTLRSRNQKSHAYKNKSYHYADAVHLGLDFLNSRAFVTTEPDVSLLPDSTGQLPTIEEAKAVKRDILWRQRNREYMEAIKGWRRAFFAGGGWRLVYPPDAETGFVFNISRSGPVCARGHAVRPTVGDVTIAGKFAHLEAFKAFRIDEPALRFRAGDTPVGRSIHPIKGLLDCSGPLESYDPVLHASRNIRVGVICTEGHESLLRRFLEDLNRPATVGQYDDADYLVDFPGFEKAFKCGLVIPAAKGDPAWLTIPRLSGGDPISMNRHVTEIITERIRRIQALGYVDVIVIYIPTAWGPFERIVTETVHLDLHDQVKAFAVLKHQRTQLIREQKIRATASARIRWWFSLALFTKALRIPWMLDATGEKVAYAGIGYAFDATNPDGRVVLGCSHVFNSAGIGMQFRLSELCDPTWREDPFTRQGNPFMSSGDAYNLGIRTRQMFYDSHQDAPERVLICKRTPFQESEIEGVLAALRGIPQVDLVTVQYEDHWRFCAADPYKEAPHGFPVRRGTGVILDNASMLLWLHGNVIGVKGDRTRSYFQGKSRIPIPMRVTRYSGETPVEVLARDLAGLTKMDWNTFALYKKLPVTVSTPGAIARIARLLDRLPAESYDYRLFM